MKPILTQANQHHELILGLLFLLFAFNTAIGNAATSSSLDESITYVPTIKAVEIRNFCQTKKLICGIEEVRCYQLRNADASSSAIQKKSTFRNYLEQTTIEHPEYQWTTQDNTVNLHPRNRKGPDLLARRLNTVSIKNISGQDAFSLVFKQAAIELNSGGSATSGSGAPARSLINLELRNVTVRDALNAIAKADGHVVWWFCSEEPEQSKATFSLEGWSSPRKQVSPK
jgi:hypothetical protein